MNILVTCAGRRHYLVKYFKEFIGEHGRIIGTDMSPYAPALAACDKTYICHAVAHPDYISQLIEICTTENIDYIFSVNDLELEILSAQKNKILEKSGATVVISNEYAIKITADKYLTYTFFKDLGISTPATFLNVPDAILAIRENKISFPLMVKPRWGSASISLIKASSIVELEKAFAQCEKAVSESFLQQLGQHDTVIIQEFIEGQEYGLDILNSLDGKFIGYCAKQKLAMRSGETDKAKPIKDSRFTIPVKKISQELQHIGNLDCDVLEKNGELYFLELNPRFGGGYPFTHCAGANHIEKLLSQTDINEKRTSYTYTTELIFAKCDQIIEFSAIK